jgi:hypothetical protein
MTNRTDIRTYLFKGDEKLFLDTNIWYYIYGPKPIEHSPENAIYINLYSKAFKKIQENKCSIYTDALIISEFVNAFARDMWQRYNRNLPEKSKINYKDYRKTLDFKQRATTIISETKKIFMDSIKCNSDFKSMDFNLFFIEYEKGNLDLNDITNDNDFKGHNIPILTANNKLLGVS